MNYAEMSDDQINLHVFEFLFGKIGEDKDMLRVWQQGKFQPCHSWADAGPIIQVNQINLNSITQGWIASDNGAHDCNYSMHENPLRAAMIVFLMMQGSKNDA